jgi:hypothetical protein
MDDSKKAWQEVSRRFAQLGTTIREHSRRLKDGQETAAQEGRGRMEEALQSATEQLDLAFTALGDTLRDPAAKEQIRAAGRSLGDALETTFTEVGDEIRRTMRSRRAPHEGGSS